MKSGSIHRCKELSGGVEKTKFVKLFLNSIVIQTIIIKNKSPTIFQPVLLAIRQIWDEKMNNKPTARQV